MQGRVAVCSYCGRTLAMPSAMLAFRTTAFELPAAGTIMWAASVKILTRAGGDYCMGDGAKQTEPARSMRSLVTCTESPVDESASELRPVEATKHRGAARLHGSTKELSPCRAAAAPLLQLAVCMLTW